MPAAARAMLRALSIATRTSPPVPVCLMVIVFFMVLFPFFVVKFAPVARRGGGVQSNATSPERRILWNPGAESFSLPKMM